MNRIYLATLALASTMMSGMAQQPSTSTTPPPVLSADDSTAVRRVVNEFADAWNRHDMKAMHDLDVDDVEWVNVVGQHWRGKDTVRRGHTAIHKGMDAAVTMSVESTGIHSIAQNVAVVVSTLHFNASSDPRFQWVGATKTRGTFIMVKRDGMWKVAQFQNTVIDPKTEHDDLPSFAETGFPPPSKP